MLGRRLQGGLFAKLRIDRKVELCKVLVEQGQEYADIVGAMHCQRNHELTILCQAMDCKNLLSSLMNEVDVIIDLLLALQPSVTDAAQRASKRAKIDECVQLYSMECLFADQKP